MSEPLRWPVRVLARFIPSPRVKDAEDTQLRNGGPIIQADCYDNLSTESGLHHSVSPGPDHDANLQPAYDDMSQATMLHATDDRVASPELQVDSALNLRSQSMVTTRGQSLRESPRPGSVISPPLSRRAGLRAASRSDNTLPRAAKDRLSLGDWFAFLDRQDDVIARRVGLGGLRREYMHACQNFKEQIDEFRTVIDPLSQHAVDDLRETLIRRFDALTESITRIGALGAQQEELDEDLLEAEGKLRDSAPILTGRKARLTHNLLHQNGFDFPGTTTIPRTSSLDLAHVRDDELAPEVEAYFAKLNRIDELEDQLLQLKHDRQRRQEDIELHLDDEGRDEDAYVLLDRQKLEQESLLRELAQAREDLIAARSAIPSGGGAGHESPVSDEDLIIDQYALRDAIAMPLPSSPSRSITAQTNSPDRTAGELYHPEDQTFLDTWLGQQPRPQEQQDLRRRDSSPGIFDFLEGPQQDFFERTTANSQDGGADSWKEEITSQSRRRELEQTTIARVALPIRSPASDGHLHFDGSQSRGPDNEHLLQLLGRPIARSTSW